MVPEGLHGQRAGDFSVAGDDEEAVSLQRHDGVGGLVATPTKKRKAKKKKDAPISLYPLHFEEAVKALLGTRPPKKKT